MDHCKKKNKHSKFINTKIKTNIKHKPYFFRKKKLPHFYQNLRGKKKKFFINLFKSKFLTTKKKIRSENPLKGKFWNETPPQSPSPKLLPYSNSTNTSNQSDNTSTTNPCLKPLHPLDTKINTLLSPPQHFVHDSDSNSKMKNSQPQQPDPNTTLKHSPPQHFTKLKQLQPQHTLQHLNHSPCTNSSTQLKHLANSLFNNPDLIISIITKIETKKKASWICHCLNKVENNLTCRSCGFNLTLAHPES